MSKTDKKVILGVEVDINDYYDSNKQPKIKPFKQYKGTFSHFGWYDVSPFKGELYSDNLDNDGIRKSQDLEMNLKDFNHHMRREGWRTDFFPPIISLQTPKKPKNGRKRIRSVVTEGDRWIPVAYYNYPLETTKGEEKRNHITNGLKANIPSDHGDRSTFIDFFNAADVLFLDGLFDPQDEQKVHDWLYHEVEIEDALSDESIRRLKEKISKLGVGGSAFMRMMDRANAMDYLNKSEKVQKLGGVGANEDDANKVALFTPSQVNCFRFFGKHILPNAKLGKQTNLVLYTTKADSAVCSEQIKTFMSLLSQLQKNACSFVMREMGAIGQKYDSSDFTSSLVNCLGAIPQKKIGGNADEHIALWNVNDLISIENYGN
jgi:hypothetical protein